MMTRLQRQPIPRRPEQGQTGERNAVIQAAHGSPPAEADCDEDQCPQASRRRSSGGPRRRAASSVWRFQKKGAETRGARGRGGLSQGEKTPKDGQRDGGGGILQQNRQVFRGVSEELFELHPILQGQEDGGCMCVYVHTDVYVYMCVCACVYACMYVHVSVCICVRARMCIRV